MDISETNDDMEISSDHGYLAPPGEVSEVDVASMGDPSLESDADADFMIEDTMPEAQDGGEGIDSHTQGHNDDVMIDEDLQDPTLNANYQHLDYGHDIKDGFEDTLDTSTDQHYELGTELVHSEVHEVIEGPAQPEISTDVPHQAAVNSDRTNSNPHQDPWNEPKNLDQPANEEASVSAQSSHSEPPQNQEPVSEAIPDESASALAAEELGSETIQLAEANPVIRDELPSEAHHLSDDQNPDQTSHVGVDEQVQNDEPSPEGAESAALGIHPVKVLHEGSEVFLFPPPDENSSETFFLHDDSLSHQSLSVLLKACREVLGNSVNDEEELEMEFHDLGLHTSEDSLHASQITMFQVVNVYLRLRQNEGDSEPEPLFVSLRTRPHFSSRFSSIARAAEEGNGSSYLGLWQEPFNTNAQDPLSHPTDDKSAQALLEEPTESTREGAQSDRNALEDNFDEHQIADPNQENIFDEADDDTGLKDQAQYGEYDESSGEPTGNEPVESNRLDLKRQEPGEKSDHSKAEDAFRTDTELNQDGSAGTSTLQGDDYIHNNDFTTDNDENLPPEGDFFDDAVQGYDDAHEGNFEFGLDEYGDHDHGGGDAEESTNSAVHPRGNHQSSLDDDFGDSSFAFINADEYEHAEETSSLYKDDTGGPYLQEHDIKSETLAYDAQDVHSELISKPLDLGSVHLSATISSDTKPTQSQPMSTPPDSLAGQHRNVEDDVLLISADTGELLDAAVLPTSSMKVNGSSAQTPPEQIFDDSDEINYEDEEEAGTNPIGETTPKNISRQAHESPKSTKRNRPGEDEEDSIEYTTPDPKKRRS